MMMLKEIESRRSVRKYNENEKISRKQLETLLEAAMHAPSACNSRPWEFIAITNRGILDEIVKIHPNAAMLSTAAAAIVVVAIPQQGRPEGYFPQDCGAATQNILLQAKSMGISSCWCGVYPKPDRVESLSKLLNIEQPKIPFNVIAIGISDEEPAKRGFFDPERVKYID